MVKRYVGIFVDKFVGDYSCPDRLDRMLIQCPFRILKEIRSWINVNAVGQKPVLIFLVINQCPHRPSAIPLDELRKGHALD